jgi:hypothetical protein
MINAIVNTIFYSAFYVTRIRSGVELRGTKLPALNEKEPF